MANSMRDKLLAFLSQPAYDDYFLVGGTARSAVNDNLLVAAGSAAVDTLALGNGLGSAKSFYVQVNASAGISAGAILFEGSNDNVTFTPMPYVDGASASSAFFSGAVSTIAASTTRFYQGPITYRYFRVRIYTAFTGGTVSATAILRTAPYPNGATQAVQATAANFNATLTPASAFTYNTVTTASTNAASAKASSAILTELAVSNLTASTIYVKLYNKASAPTVGTDTPVVVIPVVAGAVFCQPFGMGKRFATGLAVAVTGAAAVTDTTSTAAGALLNASYL
jgi:hypothetical protein